MRWICYGKPGKFVSPIHVCKVQRTCYLFATITQDSLHLPICMYFSTHDRCQLQILEFRQQDCTHQPVPQRAKQDTAYTLCTNKHRVYHPSLLCFPLSFTPNQGPIWSALVPHGSHSGNSAFMKAKAFTCSLSCLIPEGSTSTLCITVRGKKRIGWKSGIILTSKLADEKLLGTMKFDISF